MLQFKVLKESSDKESEPTRTQAFMVAPQIVYIAFLLFPWVLAPQVFEKWGELRPQQAGNLVGVSDVEVSCDAAS